MLEGCFSKSGRHFDDTKRKRSGRIVKLQGFVLEALEKLRNLQVPAKEGESEAEHDLAFRSGTALPLRQITVNRQFRRLLEAAANLG